MVQENQTDLIQSPELTQDTPAVDAPAASSSDDGDGSAAAPAAAAPPPYQPNVTYKVKNQEKKFDDWILPVIKDAETEKKIRELYETRDGISYVKADRETVVRENQQLKQVVQQKYAPMEQAVEQIEHFRSQGNLPAVFKVLGLDQRDVFKWAYEYAQMTPQAQQAMEQNAMNGLQAYGAQRQSQTAEQQIIQQAADFKTREYEMITNYNPQVSQVVADFENNHGPGSFFEQVRRTGLYHHQTRGVDISVQDAIEEVMKLYGRQPQAPASAQMQTVPGQAPQASNMVSTPTAPTPKPVIPGFQGSGTSPVKKVFNSLEDIRKHRRELEAASE
jgi:hypothetical protein